MKKVYFLFAHPYRNRSRVNATILERVSGLSHVSVCDLYEQYPDFSIHIDREKDQLEQHDVIFIQHPFLWFSMPPLLKLWMDEVLEIGFAYGPQGNSLRGKTLQLSLSVSGTKEAYQSTGQNQFELHEFLTPYIQTARMCGLNWVEPLVLFDSTRTNLERIEAHAEHVRDRVLSYTNPLYKEPIL